MRDLARFWKFYYGFLGLRIFLAAGIIAGGTLAEALGLTLMLPLLQGGAGTDPISRGLTRALGLIGAEPNFVTVLVAAIVLLLLRTGLLGIKDVYVAHLTRQMAVGARDRFITRIGETGYEFFATKDQGVLTNALTNEVQRIPYAFEQFAAVLTGALFAVGYLAMAFILSPWLALVSIILVPPALLVIRPINRKTRDYAMRRVEASASLQGWMVQGLKSLKYLKATGTFGKVASRLRLKNRELGDIGFRLGMLQVVSEQLFTPVTLIFVAVVLIVRVTVQGAPVVEAAFSLFILKRAMDQGFGVQQSFRKVLLSIGSVKVYEDLEREFDQHREVSRGQRLEPNFGSPMELRNVSFRYSSGEYVLRDISLTIHPKSIVAFVGASGAGKSTLVTLITGLLRPTDGEILLGGVPFYDLDQRRLRQGIGYVTQESVIFNDTLRNNVTLWDDGASEARLANAARQAHVTEFIPRLAHGYDTTLGNDGMAISGGQRQRVTIARELYRNIPLLIFDEATSAVDTATERDIQRGIEELRGDKTLVLIAHRLSTVIGADTIYVLKDGRIVEWGAYDVLCNANGEFARMVSLQSGVEDLTRLDHANVDSGV